MTANVPTYPIKLGVMLGPLLFFLCGAADASDGRVIVYPAPPGETISSHYQVTASGQELPVYTTRVAPADDERRWKAMDDKRNSADYFDTAAFASFDMEGAVAVTVTVAHAISAAKILPASEGIHPAIRGNSVSFTVASPRNLTVEINGEWVKSLHLFANPMETDVPRADDPKVVYFGPGVHEVSRRVVGDNQTVYIAGGAVVRAVIAPDEEFGVSRHSGLRTYAPTFELRGSNIAFRGRGILDAGGCTTHARNMIWIQGSDITLEGVILRDPSVWAVPVRQSDRVRINNVKVLGYRANSDGIDICNSRHVTVENCFIRTLDDLIVVKSDKGQGETKRVVVRRCVLWNQVAHALSIGAEIQEDIDDVLFTDCDVIHDQGREWSLRVYNCDSGRVSNVRFENIRIEEARKCLSLWIGEAVWSRDRERGHIQGVTFKNIRASGDPLTAELVGFDEEHAVEDVRLESVVLNGEPLTQDRVSTNRFVRKLIMRP